MVAWHEMFTVHSYHNDCLAKAMDLIISLYYWFCFVFCNTQEVKVLFFILCSKVISVRHFDW